ncbi:heterokaryon incompatibility protein-domain-containing protein [Daldinia eschscholtzii]|nr:heterokaryon incompatibility protein-domain-containing protein [Daldinia eschscholtzii]
MSVLLPSPVGPYSHRLERDSFRLIFLERGVWNSPLRCRLETRELNNASIYRALSYAWGSPSVTKPITVNNINMAITINLDTALRHLRREDIDIVLWVDALCINQADLDERETQVQIMRQIYSHAVNVIVFLGDGKTHELNYVRSSRLQEIVFRGDSNDNQHITQFLSHCRAGTPNKLPQEFGVFCLISLFTQLQHEHIEALLSLKSRVLRELFESLRMMLLSRWWNRMWVFQEVIVSRDVLVQYGCSVAPLELFFRAARVIQILNMEDILLKEFPPETTKVIRWFAESIINIQESIGSHRSVSRIDVNKHFSSKLLLTLLRATSNRKASDERDRVYALLGLLPVNLGIFPNYRVTTPRVYIEVVRRIIATTRSLDVLCGDLGRKSRGDLPSWVPDWSAITHDEESHRTKIITKLYNACGDTEFVCNTSMGSFWDGVVDDIYEHWLSKVDNDNEFLAVRDEFRNELRQLPVSAHYLRWTLEANHRTPESEAITFYKIQFGYLRVPAIYVDGIASCSDQFLDLADVGLLKSLLMQWLHDREGSDCSTPTPQIDIATLRALVFDAKRDSGKFKRLECDDEIQLRSWFEARTSSDNQTYWDNLGFDHILKLMSTRRRLFMTLRGIVGWGPEGLEIGDGVYVLPGGKTPYVLRKKPAPKSYNHHSEEMVEEIIGDCYIHDAMDGQYAKYLYKDGKAFQMFRENNLNDFSCIRRGFGPRVEDIMKKYLLSDYRPPQVTDSPSWGSTEWHRLTNILLV